MRRWSVSLFVDRGKVALLLVVNLRCAPDCNKIAQGLVSFIDLETHFRTRSCAHRNKSIR